MGSSVGRGPRVQDTELRLKLIARSAYSAVEQRDNIKSYTS
jgi:hypothetical protein